MNYKKTYVSKSGYTLLCKAGDPSSSLKILNFGIIELMPGESIDYSSADKESAFIILGGKCDVKFDNTEWKNVGGRRSVFEGKAHSFYIPRNKEVKISASWRVKIAVCSTHIDEDTEPACYGPDHVNAAVLGVKPWERDTHFIIDGRSNAKRLTIGEAFITPGNWAGFPPHKHDIDSMPAEGILEEIYYFLFQPQQGFALQCLYTKDVEIDECYMVKNNELVEFPKGYHTTVGAPGYNTYFLWAMAGDHQGFFRSNDPDHDWVSALENFVKKNR